MPPSRPPAKFKEAFQTPTDADTAWTLLEPMGYEADPNGKVKQTETAAKQPDVFSRSFEDRGDALGARGVLAGKGYKVVDGGGNKMKLEPYP